MTEARNRSAQSIRGRNGVTSRGMQTPKRDGYALMRGQLQKWRTEADEPYGFRYWMVDDYRDMLEYVGLGRRRLSE